MSTAPGTCTWRASPITSPARGRPSGPVTCWQTLKGQADGLKFSIRDRDAKFTAALDTVFTAIGIRIESPLRAGLSRLSRRRYVDAVRVRPREAADLAAAQAFLAFLAHARDDLVLAGRRAWMPVDPNVHRDPPPP